jgi:mono/diheme cytochrome c family protein
MKRKVPIAAGILTPVLAIVLAAQDRKKPAPANSGREMYRTYCAACHGVTGKGDGPAAAALKAPPPDLTTLARRNGGRFPAVRVYQSIEGSAMIAAHGSSEMPVWGTVFRQQGGSDEAQVKLRVRNLTSFIQSLQVR